MNNNEILLLKLGEVVLKGLNRRSFEDKLVSNVRRRMKPCGSFQIYIRQSTIYVEPQTEDCDMEAAFKAARQVFGIVTVARAVPCAKEMDAIVETAKTYLADEFAKARTFKVESRRADKQFPMNSIQISQYVGGELGQFFNVKADMHHPDLTVYVEIREKYAYIHTPSVPGAGGRPHRSGGRAGGRGGKGEGVLPLHAGIPGNADQGQEDVVAVFLHGVGVQGDLIGDPVGAQHPAVPVQDVPPGGLHGLGLRNAVLGAGQILRPVDHLGVIEGGAQPEQNDGQQEEHPQPPTVKLFFLHGARPLSERTGHARRVPPTRRKMDRKMR